MKLKFAENSVNDENTCEPKELVYEKIYNLYVGKLFAYGCIFTSDRELVKDCIHDVFVNLYRLPHDKKPKLIKCYLFVSLKNTLLNALNRRRRIQYECSESENSIPPPSNQSVEDWYICEEEVLGKKELALKIMSVLSLRQREIIHLRYIEEMDFDDICRAMDLNYQSAHNLIQRALKKMRETYVFFNKVHCRSK